MKSVSSDDDKHAKIIKFLQSVYYLVTVRFCFHEDDDTILLGFYFFYLFNYRQ